MKKKYEDLYKELYEAMGRDPEEVYNAILGAG